MESFFKRCGRPSQYSVRIYEARKNERRGSEPAKETKMDAGSRCPNNYRLPRASQPPVHTVIHTDRPYLCDVRMYISYTNKPVPQFFFFFLGGGGGGTLRPHLGLLRQRACRNSSARSNMQAKKESQDKRPKKRPFCACRQRTAHAVRRLEMTTTALAKCLPALTPDEAGSGARCR
ncbi:hypothetical protein L249_4611 [Ophiocordyceps polyrhachis-furcata BCC 54312]|uniref:Uncharacterized protein n=1 Tax=Ophiocordyceps polyrhachis-furcata BCC 54312 TaxID=1330021 RepID=A0A367LC34_9HYPO|nr:hypothetical protein L249_4611 [Ophiocordyceps polyrhachis-furcata BCC 54312]